MYEGGVHIWEVLRSRVSMFVTYEDDYSTAIHTKPWFLVFVAVCSKLRSPSEFSSEVMLKTSKSVRISEAVSKQRPQCWDIETYGVAKTTTAAKPVSLIQRLKRGVPELLNSKNKSGQCIGKKQVQKGTGENMGGAMQGKTLRGKLR